MILSGTKLKDLFTSAWYANVPVENLHFNPNSIDVRLSPFIYRTMANPKALDPLNSNPDDYFYPFTIETDYVIQPQEFILASVQERFDCSSPIELGNKKRYFLQMYDGRSTVARIGLHSHVSAGFGDYGFKGSFTLEIVNNSPWPVVLRPGMRIGQVFFVEVDKGVSSFVYKGYDQVDCKPQLPRLGKYRF